MSQRVEFNTVDVARVTVEPSLGPFAETVLAYSAVRVRSPWPGEDGADFGIRATPRDRAMASFFWLNGNTAFDLFTALEPTRDMVSARGMLVDADSDLMSAEAEFWASMQQRARGLGLITGPGFLESSSLAGLRFGERSSRLALFAQCADFHRRFIADRWPGVSGRLSAARAALERRLVVGGVEGLLSGLGDQVRWTGQALVLPSAGVTGFCNSDRNLDGRGLRIIPSFFAQEPQVYWPHDPEAPAMLLVPMRRCPDTAPRLAGARSGDKLLGRTRSAVLRTIGRQPCTTSELAAAVGITISGASQHATVLRQAGLITTVRDGVRVVHRISVLGDELLEQLT